MRYMIVVRKRDINKNDAYLEAYTGTIHETKADALEEYMEACTDPEIWGYPFVVIL